MRFFHMGMRADEIVKIGPSDNEEFPTRYVLRNGAMTTSTGIWSDNVKAVEAILNAQEDEKLSVERRVREATGRLSQLEYEIAEAERKAEVARGLLKTLTTPLTEEQMADARFVFVTWQSSGRNYMKAGEVEAMKKALGLTP